MKTKPHLSTGKSTELLSERQIGSPESKALLHEQRVCLGIGPTLKEPKLPTSWLGADPRNWKKLFLLAAKWFLSGSLSGEASRLPSVSPPGGHRGRGRPSTVTHSRWCRGARSSPTPPGKYLLWNHSATRWWYLKNTKLSSFKCSIMFLFLFLIECAFSYSHYSH